MAVQVMKGGISGGALEMILEDLKGWHKEDKREEYPKERRWELVARLIQVMLRDVTVPE